MQRVIDNKRVELTPHEWQLYQEICKAYDDERLGIKGSELFSGLFETDENGFIIFLRPPVSKYSSMEVYMYLVTVMVHQHIGSACDHVNKMAIKLEGKIKEADDILLRCKEFLNEGK